MAPRPSLHKTGPLERLGVTVEVKQHLTQEFTRGNDATRVRLLFNAPSLTLVVFRVRLAPVLIEGAACLPYRWQLGGKSRHRQQTDGAADH